MDFEENLKTAEKVLQMHMVFKAHFLDGPQERSFSLFYHNAKHKVEGEYEFVTNEITHTSRLLHIVNRYVKITVKFANRPNIHVTPSIGSNIKTVFRADLCNKILLKRISRRLNINSKPRTKI